MRLINSTRLILESDGVSVPIKNIIKAPTIDAAPVVHGMWLRDGDFLICLNCEAEINIKNSLGNENHKNFCPNCGAMMKGGA